MKDRVKRIHLSPKDAVVSAPDIDDGKVVGYTAVEASPENNSAGFRPGRETYKAFVRRNRVAPVVGSDQSVFEQLNIRRNEQGLAPDAIEDHDGRKLRETIDIMPE